MYYDRENEAMKELMQIRGIGEQLARALVRKGILNIEDFTRADDERLLQVSGIGPGNLPTLREQAGHVDGS